MNTENLVKLKSLLLANATLTGLDDAAATAAINARSYELQSFFVNTRTLGALIGTAKTVALLEILKYQAAQATNEGKLFAYVLDLLQPEAGGVDVGMEESQLVLDQWAAAGLLSAEDAAAIKAKGRTSGSSLALSIGEENIVEVDVTLARQSNAADATMALLSARLERGMFACREAILTYATQVRDGQSATEPTMETLLQLF